MVVCINLFGNWNQLGINRSAPESRSDAMKAVERATDECIEIVSEIFNIKQEKRPLKY